MVIIMKNIEGDFEDITPHEIFSFAYELDEIRNDLNSTNSAVNRTIYVKIYYSVFLFLREWLKEHMGYKSLKGEHTKLPNFIKNNGPFGYEKNKEIYRGLTLLKKLRHRADYKLNVPKKYSLDYNKWEFTTIKSAFEIAESIIKTFKEF